MKGKKTLVSAVLLAALVLGGCNAQAQDPTKASEDNTTAATSESAETSAFEDTKASEDATASESSEETSSAQDPKFDKYKELTDIIKDFIEANEGTDDLDDSSKIYDLLDPTGLMEQIKTGEAYNMRYAFYDVDGDGTDELFVIKDFVYSSGSIEEAIHDTSVLAVFSIGNDGSYVGITSGWERNRLQFMKDGRFYRTGAADANTIVMEYQEMDPITKKVESKETYFTDGTRDSDGNLVLFQAKNPAMPAFGRGTDENVGIYLEPQIADDIYQFTESVSLEDYYGI